MQKVPKIWGTLGPRPLGRGVADPLETRYSATCVTVPNFVAVSLAVWELVGIQKIRGRWGPVSLGCGRI